MSPKAKTVFYCTECGNETPKWQGKCTACGAWNTVVEQPPEAKKRADDHRVSGLRGGSINRPRALESIETT
ncbi:MAG: DNA repair protein RadA, partial [Oscillospiraceae bacterium]